MKFHLMALTFFFFSITATAGRPMSRRNHKARTHPRVNRTMRVDDFEKNNYRNKFLSLVTNQLMTSDSHKFLVRNQVDDVISWLASVEQSDSAGKRGRFEEFLRFQMK